MINQRTYWEHGTGKNIYGHRREGNTGHGDTGMTVTPPSRKVRPAPYTIQRGGGVGALEASRDTETGQEASRAAPVPGPTV